MIDTHCHLQIKPLRDKIKEVIGQAKKEGVTKIICPMVKKSDLEWIKNQIDLEGVYFGLGIHPGGVDEVDDWEKLQNQIIDLCKKYPQKIVAIGEIGLDVKYPNKAKQIEMFKKQIELAGELDLPIIIHNRGARNEFKEIFQNQVKVKGVFHAFVGKPDWLYWIVNKGFYVGLGGMVTWESFNQSNWEVLKSWQDKIVLETDAPFLLPTILKGKKSYNQPVNVKIIANFIAYKLGLGVKDIDRITTENSNYLFKLSP